METAFQNKIGQCALFVFSSYLAVDMSMKIYRSFKKQQRKARKKLQKLTQKEQQLDNQEVGQKDIDLTLLRKQHREFQKSEMKIQKKLIPKQSEDIRNMNTLQKLPIKIVLTGGPCSGKTTALSKLQDILLSKGFKVFIVPEAATLLSSGGANLDMSTWKEDKQLSFQQNLMNLQRNLEDRFQQLAEIDSGNQQAVLLCDRGMMDGKAYLTPENWDILLDEMDVKESDIREKRYDAIIHLVTSANGASKFYNLDNAARYEKELDQAIQTDLNLQKAWSGHPSLVIIPADTDFEKKIQKACQNCLRFCGYQTPQIIFSKKFFINKEYAQQLNENFKKNQSVETYIHQDIFLLSDGTSKNRKIRKRGQREIFTFYLIESKTENQKQSQTRRRITNKRYNNLLEASDPSFKVLTRLRQCFNDNSQSYYIDSYLDENKTIMFSTVLIWVESEDKQTKIPSFLDSKFLVDITDNPEYFSKNIAKKDWKLKVPTK